MTTQTVVLLWPAIACLGLGVFTMLAIPSVNPAFNGVFMPKPITANQPVRTRVPPAERRYIDA